MAIDSIDDMRLLLDGLPLDQVTTSMTINSTAADPAAALPAGGRGAGRGPEQLGGTIQNDILKEYVARGTYIYPPRPSMRIITDIFAYCQEHLPQWNTISISGYHIREAGSTAVQEIAFTLANGIAYVQAALDAGLDVDEFAPRLSFFWNGHNNFFEEVAKFRAARRMWAKIMTERFGAKDEKSKLLRFHTQTGGSTLTAQQPENNIVRVALQALAAVLGGTQSLHTNGFDEALGLPTEKAAKLALRTQQIIGHESGVVDTVDPLAGSYFVEALTDEVEAEAWDYIDKIDGMGGAVAAIEAGFMQDEIEQAAYAYAKAIDDGEKVIVGVNKYVDDEPEPVEVFPIDPELQRSQADRVRTLKAEPRRPTRSTPARRRGRGGAGHAEPAGADEGGAAPPAPPSARSATSCATSSASTSRPGDPRADRMRFVIIGGGPAGVQAATHAARLGAEVTLIERDIVGGAAHLWDCIPSKAMIATGGVMSASRRAHHMGLPSPSSPPSTLDALRTRIADIQQGLTESATELLASQGVRLLAGTGTFKGPHEVVADVEGQMIEVEADAVLISTGSRPRIPDWAEVDGERVLTTRQAYPPPELPEHLVVIGSGVTGVEFVHMFSSFGSKVTLIVSRQQVLPQKDPEVAAALEDNFLQRGVKLLKGARAEGISRDGNDVVVALRRRPGRARSPRPAGHRVAAQLRGPGLGERGDRGRRGRLRADQPALPVERGAHLRGRRRVGQAAAGVGGVDAGSQGGRARDGSCTPESTATSTTTRRPAPSSPSPRSPTWAWPRPRRSPWAARSASPRCRSRRTPRR